jgi:hypothetical protein
MSEMVQCDVPTEGEVFRMTLNISLFLKMSQHFINSGICS